MSDVSDVSEHPGDLLSAYLDGELSASEEREVESHLVACGACNAELDDLGAARRMLRELPPVPAPPGFTRGLVERRRRSVRRGTGLALVAASVAVILGLALADPQEDQPCGSQPMSLSGDASRLDTTPGPFSSRPGRDVPPGATSPSSTLGTTTTTTTTTTTATTAAENESGPEGSSDPDSFGDRIEDVATNLLELIGG
jgi:predicted anti-sigma-YlaC factor YlaD